MQSLEPSVGKMKSRELGLLGELSCAAQGGETAPAGTPDGRLGAPGGLLSTPGLRQQELALRKGGDLRKGTQGAGGCSVPSSICRWWQMRPESPLKTPRARQQVWTRPQGPRGWPDQICHFWSSLWLYKEMN